MRRFALLPAVLLAVLAVSPPAAAFGAAPDIKDRWNETFVDEDFCGTGVAVDVHDRGVAQVYDGDTVFRLSSTSRTTFTYQGREITLQSAGHVLAESQDAPFDEPHTEIIRESGLRVKVSIPGQGVITSDHGLIVYQLTLVANTDPDPEAPPLMVTDVEVLKEAGGHPAFFSDTDVFCDAAVDYFGIG